MIQVAPVYNETEEEIDVFHTLALRAIERSGAIAVETIETLDQFDAVRDEFERVYRADLHRTTFVSWSWLRAYFASMAGSWRVLAARSRVHGRYVAFLPLEFRQIGFGPFAFDNELYLGINPTADYTGLVMENDSWEAIEALAMEIDHMTWDNFHMHNVSDPRVEGIVDRLQRRNRVVVQPQNASRLVRLPSSWDDYLKERLTYKWRAKMRTVVRTLGRLPGFRFEEARAENIDAYIETLLQLNHQRWQTNLSKARATYGELFRTAFEQGVCRIFVAWQKERPIAAQAAFVDDERCSWDVYMLGYNQDYAKYSPGVGIIALTMERAIGEGFQTYDFLRGSEDYKERFEPESRSLNNWIVRRYGVRNMFVKLGRLVYYRNKAIARKVFLGKPLSTSSYMI